MEFFGPWFENEDEWSKDAERLVEEAIRSADWIISTPQEGARTGETHKPDCRRQATRIPTDHQVVHDALDVYNEWKPVGPFLFVEGHKIDIPPHSTWTPNEEEQTEDETILEASDGIVEENKVLHPALARDYTNTVGRSAWTAVPLSFIESLAEEESPAGECDELTGRGSLPNLQPLDRARPSNMPQKQYMEGYFDPQETAEQIPIMCNQPLCLSHAFSRDTMIFPRPSETAHPGTRSNSVSANSSFWEETKRLAALCGFDASGGSAAPQPKRSSPKSHSKMGQCSKPDLGGSPDSLCGANLSPHSLRDGGPEVQVSSLRADASLEQKSHLGNDQSLQSSHSKVPKQGSRLSGSGRPKWQRWSELQHPPSSYEGPPSPTSFAESCHIHGPQNSHIHNQTNSTATMHHRVVPSAAVLHHGKPSVAEPYLESFDKQFSLGLQASTHGSADMKTRRNKVAKKQ